MKVLQTNPSSNTAYRAVLETATASVRAFESNARPRGAGRTPHRSVLRWPMATAVLVVGAVHLPPAPEHLREAPYIGVLFVGVAVACAALAGLLVWRDIRAVWALAAATAGTTALAYLASRTVGLPEIGDEIGNWSDPLGTVAMAAELATVVLAWFVLGHDRSDTRRPPRFQTSDIVRESTSTQGKDDNS